MRLYELTDEWNNALNTLDAAQTPEEVDAAHLLIAEIGEALETKLVNIAKLMDSLEAEAEAWKVREDRFKARRMALENHAERLKRYAESAMIGADLDEVKADGFKLTIQKNNPSVKVTDEKSIPKKYFIEQEPTLDKKSLLADLKALSEEETIPGAEIQRTRSIRIKIA